MRWAASSWLSPACWLCTYFPPFLWVRVRVLHSPGVHRQVEPDPWREGRGGPGDAGPTSIQHPPSSQHQPVGVAGTAIDLEVQLDQAWGAVGGEGRHDPPAAAGQELQALAAQRPPPVPPDVHDIGATQHGVKVAVVGLDACRVQRDGQHRQAGCLLKADDPDRWKRIEVDDPKAVQPTGDGPAPQLAPRQRDAAAGRIDDPGPGWSWRRWVGGGDRRLAALTEHRHDNPRTSSVERWRTHGVAGTSWLG
jgi:hypothetical protein